MALIIRPNRAVAAAVRPFSAVAPYLRSLRGALSIERRGVVSVLYVQLENYYLQRLRRQQAFATVLEIYGPLPGCPFGDLNDPALDSKPFAVQESAIRGEPAFVSHSHFLLRTKRFS